MGILNKYNERIAGNQIAGSLNTGIIRDPAVPRKRPDPATDQFNKTSLDLESPLPLGGPINVSYTTLVGEDIVTSPTTQPYTPKSTYTDSFTDPRLIARTIDPIK
tara:strand:- start:1706 stop:2020 length:315 start_codon:yes stop_codon:yes gene_type:complete